MAEVPKETVETLRGLAAGEPAMLQGLLGLQLENLEDSGLDPRAYSLVKVAALIALDATPEPLAAQVAAALDAGATPDELLGVLVAVAPQVGTARVVATTPALMAALGLSRQDR